jgi:lysine-N-methylase
MNLPVMMPELKSQRFSCHSCTNCCRELVVHLTPADRKKIDDQNWASRIGAEPYVRLGREYVLNHKPGGGCVFLMEDHRCRIHAEHGLAAKPLACQLYPFTLHRENGNLRAGVRFDCPSAAGNKGEPIAQTRHDIRRLASEFERAGGELFPTAKPIELRRGYPIAAKQLDAIIERLDAWLRDSDRSLDDRLQGLCSLCDTLDAAKLDAMSQEQFGELILLLISELENTDPPEDLTPPADRHRSLIRMTVFAHSEHVTLAHARAPLFTRLYYRLDQLRRGRQMLRGTGNALPLVPGAPTIPFERVESVRRDAATSNNDCDELLTRYLRVRILSHSAFGGGYYDWPVIDGLRAMILSIAAARWLARYLAATAGRSTWQLGDLQQAIGIIDRAAGRAKELGRASAALRIRFFAQAQGFARIILHDPDNAGLSAPTTAG